MRPRFAYSFQVALNGNIVTIRNLAKIYLRAKSTSPPSTTSRSRSRRGFSASLARRAVEPDRRSGTAAVAKNSCSANTVVVFQPSRIRLNTSCPPKNTACGKRRAICPVSVASERHRARWRKPFRRKSLFPHVVGVTPAASATYRRRFQFPRALIPASTTPTAQTQISEHAGKS
jgi:hypothetical protein